MRVLGLTIPNRVFPTPPKRHESLEPVIPTNSLLRQPATDVVQFGMAPPRPTETVNMPPADVIPALLPQAKEILGHMANRAGVKVDSLSLDTRPFVQGAVYYDDLAHDMTIDASKASVIMRGKTTDGDQDKAFAFVHLQEDPPNKSWVVAGGNMPYGSLVSDVAAELTTQPQAQASLLQGLPGSATSGLTLIKYKEGQQPPTFKVLSTTDSQWPSMHAVDGYAMKPGDVLNESELGQKVVKMGRMYQEKTLTALLTGAAGNPSERERVGQLLPQMVGDAKAADMLPQIDGLTTEDDVQKRYAAMAQLVKTSLVDQRIRLKPYYDSLAPM